MNGLIDGADRVYWWLRQRPPVAGGLLAVVVAVIAGLLLLGGDDKPAKIPADAVATVDGSPIKETALSHWKDVYTSASTGQTPPTAAQAQRAAFELLAGSEWIVQEADRQDITVSTADAKKATDDYLKAAEQSTGLQQAALLKQMGTSLADVTFQQRIALLASKLQAKIVKGVPKPTDAEIAKTYKDEPARWASPSERDVEVVITATTADAQAALKALKGGSSIAEVTQKYSSNATLTSAQGKLTGLKPGSTDSSVERPIFAAPKGEYQGPVKAGNGYMVFKVTAVKDLPDQTLAQAKDKISAALTSEAQNTATNAFLGDLRKRWKPKTRCLPTLKGSDYCGSIA